MHGSKAARRAEPSPKLRALRGATSSSPVWNRALFTWRFSNHSDDEVCAQSNFEFNPSTLLDSPFPWCPHSP